MQLQKIPFRSASAFSEFFLKYIEQHPDLIPFYNRYPSLDNFAGQLQDKAATFPDSSRQVLASSLRRQYQSIKTLPAVEANIAALADAKTFTITTGRPIVYHAEPLVHRHDGRFLDNGHLHPV